MKSIIFTSLNYFLVTLKKTKIQITLSSTEVVAVDINIMPLWRINNLKISIMFIVKPLNFYIFVQKIFFSLFTFLGQKFFFVKCKNLEVLR